jgi:glycosyl transferase family 25
MIKELAKYTVNFEIIEAVDGSKLNINKLTKNGIIKHKPADRILRKGEYGCYLSHIETINKFLKTDKKYCLILEDDVDFVIDFQNKCSNILQELKDDNISFDMLFLSTNCGSYGKTQCDGKLITKNTYKPIQLGYGMHSYILTREGAQKIINLAFPIFCPIDVLIDIQFETNKNMNIIKCTNQLAKVREINDSDTISIK